MTTPSGLRCSDDQQGSAAESVIDHRRQTPFSDPGALAHLVDDVPSDVAGVSEVARNLIVHYRASGLRLPESSRDDINARWLADILTIDQARHAAPLATPRDGVDRVQGCCRDHTLFCVGALRHHGIAARSRVGFAGYFVDGFHHDHVIVEAWMGGRWVRFDPELAEPRPGVPAPADMAYDTAGGRGFVTAATAWMAHRRGDLDVENHGVDPDLPVIRGERFVFDEVIYEVAHRFGDELLLWDSWGRIGMPGEAVTGEDTAWLDEIAALLVAADEGDLAAERRLLARYRDDAGLHPGATIVQASPYGDPPIEIALNR